VKHLTTLSLFAATAAMAAPGVALAADFKLSVRTIAPGSTLGAAQDCNAFGCSGRYVSPALAWIGAPDGTRRFAATVCDPEAPTGSGGWHWVACNVPASDAGLLEPAGGADGKGLPAGAVQGRTDFGAPGFGGACPPVGNAPHRYVFTVVALQTERIERIEKIELPADASAARVGFMLDADRLASASAGASVTAKYGRSK